MSLLLDPATLQNASAEPGSTPGSFELLALELANVGTWEWNAATDVLRWSRALPRLFSVQEDGATHTRAAMVDRIAPEDRDRVGSAMRGAPVGVSVDCEFRVQLPSGEQRWLLVRAARTPGGDRMLGVVVDITTRKRQEEQAERERRLQEQMLGVLGHDLRNPLAAIHASATVLTRPEIANPRRLAAAERILRSSSRMAAMVTDVLDFIRARMTGGLPIDPRPSDLHAIARQVVEEFLATESGRKIELAAEPNLTGEWDPGRLAQLLSNLVGNALRYGDPEHPIVVSVRSDEDSVLLEVKNQGPLIPAQLIPALFDPFRRGSDASAQATRTKGLGLGLFIVRQIVLAHGGAVDVSSTVETGTVFTIALPRKAAAQS